MKSTYKVYALILLLPALRAPLLDAAASSGPVYWQPVNPKTTFSTLHGGKADHTLAPTAEALVEQQNSEHYIPARVKTQKELMLQAILNSVPRTAPAAEPARRVYGEPTLAQLQERAEMKSYRTEALETQKAEFLRDFTVPALKAAETKEVTKVAMEDLSDDIYLINSDNQCVSLHAHKVYESTDRGLVVADQNYAWKKTGTRRWRPTMDLFVEKELDTKMHMRTEMANELNASLSSLPAAELAYIRARVDTLNMIDGEKGASVVAGIANKIDNQLATLAKEKEALLSKLAIDPSFAYLINAVVTDAEQTRKEDLEKQSQTNCGPDDHRGYVEDIFRTLFGTKEETQNNRHRVVELYGRAARHVKDPNIGSRFYGTYEPKSVKKLRELKTQLEEKGAITQLELTEYIASVKGIHREAIAALNKLVKQNDPKKIGTSSKPYRTSVRDETQAQERIIGELNLVLRQIEELEHIKAALDVDVQISKPTASLSSSSSSSSSSSCSSSSSSSSTATSSSL